MIITYSWLDDYQIIGISGMLSYLSTPELEDVVRGSPSYTDPLQTTLSYTDPLQTTLSYTDPITSNISYR